MAAHAAAMRRRRGEHAGAGGVELVKSADETLRTLGYVDAAKKTAMLAPGW
jgi:hypothetical protein